jgi:hypothetical protein
VVKLNASRIWDIGDMEYPVISSFLNDLPQDQLTEIESNSEVSMSNHEGFQMPRLTFQAHQEGH